MAALESPETRRLVFPVLQRIRLSHFSLYSLSDKIEFRFEKGITCLAGANGLGKSTFLQVIGYGLTGVVPKPSQKFVTVDDYYRDLRAFTRDYFDGRIKPEHMDIAEVELEMQLGESRVTITRGFVESEALRTLTIEKEGTRRTFTDNSPEERQSAYEELIKDVSGLGSFKEFVFIHSFVLTFDERRHLLFWDTKVLETCLLIFIGVDRGQRAEVERLRREMEKSGSRVRNLVFDIKQARTRLEDLQTALTGIKGDKDERKTYTEYEELKERAERAKADADQIDDKIRDTKLSVADSASRSSSLRTEYNSEFFARLGAKKSSRQHPFVQQALVEAKCSMCGASGPTVTKVVKARVENSECPLCATALPKGKNDAKMMARLVQLDEALAREKKILESNTLKIRQLEAEREKRLIELHALENEVEEFEDRHKTIIARRGKGGESVAELKKIFEQQIAAIEQQRDKERKHLSEVTKSYRAAQKDLEQQYLNVREIFVPKFAELAKLFLGVDLDISLESRENVTLILEVQKTKRRAEHQLSESQRFFIDIALRMAFAQFSTSDKIGAPLYIDTPEGSLDLAYEAQAGQMIAKFAREGHSVFMTANVNTSQLLQSVATNSRQIGFGVQRLYHWTEMSEIQEKQQGLFERTLDHLEKLAKKDGR